jgi:succinoglycan biosynthesis protein ExoM
MNTSAQVTLTFLICTYHREALLLKCLQSIPKMEGMDSVRCEIVVIDNSDAGTASQVVADFGKSASLPVKYVNAHPANISVARNAGIENSNGKYIAMIDDDMTLAPGWLAGISPYLTSDKFDVISGPVFPVYENEKIATKSTRDFFLRDIKVKAPLELHITGARRTNGFIPSTSNAIFRRETCFSNGNQFDTRYGKSGGEDLDIFCILYEQHRKFGWLPDVLAYEYVPAARCTVDYLKKRSYAGGQIYASIRIQNSRHPLALSIRIKLVALIQNIMLTARMKVIEYKNAVPVDDLVIRHEAVKGKLHWEKLIELYGGEK